MELTSFVGRELDVVHLRRLLTAGRLVTITGPGGVGKTRLGLRILEEAAAEFQDGARMVDLLAGAVDEPGRNELIGFARDRRVLLLVDACDEDRPACGRLVVDLLHAAPRSCVLATARSPLGVPGERQWRLGPLSTPGANVATGDVATLAGYEAVQLFVQRVAALQPGFALTNDNAPLVLRTCRELDGLPRQLEVAAARAPVAGLDSLVGSQLEMPRDLERSVSSLTPTEDALLKRLAVFAGSWSLEAAEFVCAVPDLDPLQFLDSLQGLVRASLVLFEPRPTGGRYALLKSIRRLYLPIASESDHERLVEWYQRLADGQDRWSVDARPIETLELELDNLCAIFARGETDDARRVAALRLCVACSQLWLRRYSRVGRAWLERLWTGPTRSLDPLLHARAAWLSAALARCAGSSSQAVRELGEAVQLLQAHGDQSDVVTASYYLGEAHLEIGDAASALAVWTRCWETARAHRHVNAPSVQARIAMAWLQAGNLDQANAHATHALRDAQLTENNWNLTLAWEATASIAFCEGNFADAVHGFERSLACAQASADRWAWIDPSLRLAEAYLVTLERRRAAGILRDVLDGQPGTEAMPVSQLRRLMALTARVVAPVTPDQAERFQRAAARRWPTAAGADSVALARLRAEARRALENVLGKSSAAPAGQRWLSEREMEVARRLARGLTNRQIAAELSLSEGTVRAHVSHILDKLDVRSRVQVGAWLQAARPGSLRDSADAVPRP